MPNAGSVLSDDLNAVPRCSRNKRTDTLRRATHLFLTRADRLNDEPIGVLDGALVQPIHTIEAETLAEISAPAAS
jgi:hypothetical protein